MSRIFRRLGPRAAFILLIVASVALFGCSGEGSESPDPAAESGEGNADGDAAEQKPEKKSKKPRKEPTTSVTAAPVARGDLVIPVVAEGSIRARHATDIKFEIDGDLTHLWIREGQRVRKGQKLASLDDREYQLALEEANSRYLQAMGQLAVEEEGYNSEGAERVLSEQTSELARMEREGLITREQRLDRELELGMAAVRDGAYRRELIEVRSGLAAARADAARLQLNLERTVLHAPFSGVVTGLTLSPGERVQDGQTLCRLVDDVNVEAAVGVLESDLGALQVGRSAFLQVPALGETLPVKVDVISPDIDEESRTCSVLMRLRAERGRIKPGMFVRALIAGQTFPDRLLVPREAILTRDGRPMLFRVDGNRARWVYVQVGLRNEQLVEITRVDQGGPLEPGTLVVVDNHLTLTHDAKIKVKKTLETSDPWAAPAEQG